MDTPLIIEGSRITDIESLYVELNRVFMAEEDWTLGPSLDALHDLLGGGYGALQGKGTHCVIWRDFATARAALGVAATRDWLQQKLAQPNTFNAARITAQLQALEDGSGPTYFDIVMEIFADHPDILLRTE